MRSGVIGLRLPARLIRDSLTYFIFFGYNLTKAFWVKTTAANDAVSHPEAKLPVRNSKAERKNKLAQEDLCRDKKSRWSIAVAADQDIPRAAGWGSGAMHGLTLLLLEVLQGTGGSFWDPQQPAWAAWGCPCIGRWLGQPDVVQCGAWKQLCPLGSKILSGSFQNYSENPTDVAEQIWCLSRNWCCGKKCFCHSKLGKNKFWAFQ